MPSIKPLRLRPLTPGCSACARQGQAAHGYRHSVVCQKRRAEWLAQQEEPPVARAVRAQGEEDLEPKHTRPRVMAETEVAAAHSAAAADQTTRPTTRLRHKTPPVNIDVDTAGRKRRSETPPEEMDEERAQRGEKDDDVRMMPIIQTLDEEVRMTADQPTPEEQIQFENGVDWVQKSWTKAGDLKEMQGLFDKNV